MNFNINRQGKSEFSSLLCLALAGIAILSLSSCTREQKSTDETEMGLETVRPNFLLITCEDISPYLSFYGDSLAHTPNLDKLAAESLVFDHAFATVGVCAPSRSSLITGMYPVSIGTHNMRTGASVAGWGKREHINLPKDRLDREGTPFSIYSAVLPPEVKCYTNYLREAGYFCTNNHKTDMQFSTPISAFDENSSEAHFKNRKPGQPFLSIFNFEITHESRLWMKAEDSLRIDPTRVEIPSYLPDFDQARVDFARNYSNIEELDAQIGALLKELEESGELENTYVFFFSDHGGPLPRGKRLIYDSGLKVPFMVRSPQGLIEGKKDDENGGASERANVGRSDRLISFVDVAPTILSLAGIEIPGHMQGEAFMGTQEDQERNYIFGSGDRFDNCYDRIRSVRNKDFMLVKNYHTDRPRYQDIKYRKQIPMMPKLLEMREEGALNQTQMLWFEATKPEIEFYDVKVDPEQVRDLSDDPKYAEEIETLLTALEDWQKSVDDKGMIPEAELLEGMWPGMIQPVTSTPEVRILKENATETPVSYEAVCSTPGADLVYRFSPSSEPIEELDHWQLYTGPITSTEMGGYLHFRATRIGYVDSEEVVIEF